MRRALDILETQRHDDFEGNASAAAVMTVEPESTVVPYIAAPSIDSAVESFLAGRS